MTKALLLAAAAVIATAGSASAQDGQFHLGAGYTYLDADGVEFDVITLRGGYDFTDYLGAEAELSFGLSDETVSALGVTGDLSYDYGFGLFGKAQYPLTEQFSVFARLGYVYTEAEASAALAGQNFSISDGESGIAYGVGAEWAFAGPNAVRFDYTRNDYDAGETDAFTLSYVRRF